MIFSDVGPDIRWVGNEEGHAAETCWATYDPVGEDGGAAAPGYVREKEGETGHRHGSHWMPAECDVSIRPGWFWHAEENAKVKTPAQLVDLYSNPRAGVPVCCSTSRRIAVGCCMKTTWPRCAASAN